MRLSTCVYCIWFLIKANAELPDKTHWIISLSIPTPPNSFLCLSLNPNRYATQHIPFAYCLLYSKSSFQNEANCGIVSLFQVFQQVIISHDVFKYFACPCLFVIKRCQRQRWRGDIFVCVSVYVDFIVCLEKYLVKYWAGTFTKLFSHELNLALFRSVAGSEAFYWVILLASSPVLGPYTAEDPDEPQAIY